MAQALIESTALEDLSGQIAGDVIPPGEPELRLDVQALASVYLGGFTFAELARGLRVEELQAGALERADALFATAVEPWCPEIF